MRTGVHARGEEAMAVVERIETEAGAPIARALAAFAAELSLDDVPGAVV